MNTRKSRIAFALTVGLLTLVGALALLGAWSDELPVAQAQSGTGTIRVSTTGTDAVGCGSVVSPCHTVQYAVDQASDGDEILVASGTYTDVQARAGITQVAYISKSLTLRGGYSAGFTETNPISYPTTLDAEENGRVLYVTGSGITVTVEGLRITGGLANNAWGGGIRVYWDHEGAPITVMLRHNIVVSNTASGGFPQGYGGGLSLSGAAATVVSNTIRDNVVETGGGGAYLIGDAPILLTSNTVQSNTAATHGGGIAVNHAYDAALIDNDILSNTARYGCGGVCITGNTNAVLDDNLIAGNRVDVRGGGVRAGSNLFGGLRFKGNVIRDNVASGSYGWGGGVYIDNGGGGHTLEGNVIQNNVATGTNDSGGGGLYLYDEVTLRNNAVIGNHAGAHGGGMYLNSISSNESHLWHTTLASNTAGDGSAVYVHYNHPAFTNTIIYSQTVGVYNDGNGTTVSMTNTLWDSVVTRTMTGPASGVIETSGDVSGMAALAADGYHLTATSDAIDAGLPNDVSTDVDGQFRSMGPAPDLGADEYPYYADLGLTKARRGSGAVAAGAPITYTLTVSNSASAEWQADGSLVDTFEPISALDSVTVAAMTGDECQVGGAVVTCTLPGVLTDTTRTVTVTAVTTDTFDGVLTNTASIAHTGGAIDQSAGNNTGGPIAVTIGLRNIYLPLVVRNFQ